MSQQRAAAVVEIAAGAGAILLECAIGLLKLAQARFQRSRLAAQAEHPMRDRAERGSHCCARAVLPREGKKSDNEIKPPHGHLFRPLWPASGYQGRASGARSPHGGGRKSEGEAR